MTGLWIWTAGLLNLTVVPLLLVGALRKGKAGLQTRQGAPLWQPFYDVAKLLRKGETVSEVASWVFCWTPRLGLITAMLAALMVPWAGLPAPLGAHADLILLDGAPRETQTGEWACGGVLQTNEPGSLQGGTSGVIPDLQLVVLGWRL